MKKIILFLLLVLFVFTWWQKSHKREIHPSEDKPIIVTSGYVGYALAKQIGGDKIKVSMLMQPNAEPHAFEPTPGSLVTVHHADLFFYISFELEPWVRDVIANAIGSTRTIGLADFLEKTPDPHVWLDFDNVLIMARKIAQQIADVDRNNQSFYIKNFAAFEQEIAELKEAYNEGLSSCQSREVVHAGHMAFGLLAEKYNLKMTSLSGSSHEGEHSVKHMVDLIKHMKSKRVRVVFTEEAVSPRLAQTVAEETGAQILPLFTVEHISKEDYDNNATYGELMRRNLESLQWGLVCPA